MGKKHVIKKSEEEIIKETDKIEAGLKKEPKAAAKAQGKVSKGKVYVFSSYNNTIITLSDLSGNVLSQKSAGSIGFKGAKKGTAFAASKVGGTVADIAVKIGMEKIHILVKGIGPGRDSAIRSLMTKGLDILSIKDITPIPHNGCRPRKVRRV